MSIAIVQNAANVTTNVNTLSVTISPSTSGNTLVVSFILKNSTVITVTSLTDNVGNSYTLIPGTTSNFTTVDTVEMHICNPCLSGATTITANFSGTVGQPEMFVVEFSGVSPTSPISSTGVLNNQTGAIVTPSLTTTTTESFLYAVPGGSGNINMINSPWATLSLPGGTSADDYYAPGAVGTFQGTTPYLSGNWNYSGIVLEAPSLTLMLNLFDSVVSNDSMTDAFSLPVSDSVISSDTSPQSFSAQSDMLVPVQTPVVETLVKQLIPSFVKVYFKIQE
jgi:hypothetical protein